MKGKSEPTCIGRLLFARTYKGNMNYFINLNGHYSNSIPEETESQKFSDLCWAPQGESERFRDRTWSSDAKSQASCFIPQPTAWQGLWHNYCMAGPYFATPLILPADFI